VKKKPTLPERSITIIIRASDTHCCTWWPDKRKRCPHLSASRSGAIYHCGVFHGRELSAGVERLPECLAAEGKP